MGDFQEYDYEDFTGDFDEFKHEVNVFERVSMGRLGTKVGLKDVKGKSTKEVYEKLSKSTYEPKERLAVLVQALGYSLKDVHHLPIYEKDISDIIEYIPILEKPGDINPMGFLLGYIGTKGGREMNRENITKIFKELPGIKEGGVMQEDVIRYCRFWLLTRGTNRK
jgi:hypothetical protein